jgi:gliding motility-associated-like protein
LQTGANATGLAPTSYVVTVTDANGCTAQATVNITEPPVLTTSVSATPGSICIGQPSTLSANANGGTPNYTYTWQPSGPQVTPTTTGSNTYTVTVTDQNGCTTQGTVAVTVNPLPVVSFTPTAAGCVPLCVNFTNTTPNSATQTWNFGDNTSSILSNPTHCYTVPGQYSVTLTVTDINGCSNSLTQQNIINAYPLPTACFNSNPSAGTISNPTINFSNCSAGATSWLWNFGDPLGSTSSLQNPVFTYPDTGTYLVTLIVCNSNNCCDTILSTVVILGEFIIYVPNAFTPNGDGNNDGFFPEGIGIDPNNFEMWIFDRWGNLIYYTQQLNKPWDGKVQGGKSGEIAQQDVYVWKIVAHDVNTGNKHNLVGHVSLIK